MKSMAMACAAAVCALVALSTPAAEKEGRGACRGDVEKFCKDVQPGGGRIMKCLAQHQSELSQPCQDRIAEGKEKAHEFMAACKADAQKLCEGVQPGGGRVWRCLDEHKSELSPGCQEKMAQRGKKND